MSRRRMPHRLTVVVVGGLLLAACAETQLAVHTAKTAQGARPTIIDGTYKPMEAPFKIGDAYQIEGKWFYPAEDYRYTEVGIASWYGPQFHGKRTANGEVFNMFAMTAAHRTLPMPSAIRVTNLANGRSVVLRVNDRGPFARGRIIDVSQRAAEHLDFRGEGTARVKVEILPRESRQLKSVALNVDAARVDQIGVNASPRIPVATAPLRSVNGRPVALSDAELALPKVVIAPQRPRLRPPELPTGVVILPVSPLGIHVQVGAFANFRNALRMRDRVWELGPAQISRHDVAGTSMYRVRLGPLENIAQADFVLNRVIASGVQGARLVFEDACARTPC